MQGLAWSVITARMTTSNRFRTFVILTKKQTQLIRLLASGEWCSGPHLAELLGCSRGAISQILSRLADVFQEGWTLERDAKRGYRLILCAGLLDAELISNQIDEQCASFKDDFCVSVETHLSCESTNKRAAALLRNMAEGHTGRYSFVFADHQTSGKGRRGRHWLSTLGGSLLFSVAFQIDTAQTSLEGLSLVVGLAVAEALESFGAKGILLKWPNDLIVVVDNNKYKKLGGVLIELSGALDGQLSVIVGVGVNLISSRVHTPSDTIYPVDSVGLQELIPSSATLDINMLASTVGSHLINTLSKYSKSEFSSFIPAWKSKAAFLNEQIRLYTAGIEMNQYVEGRMIGIDSTGRLLLKSAQGELKAYSGGELGSSASEAAHSLRPAQ